MTDTNPKHSDDLDIIWGVKGDSGIAAFLKTTERKVYYLIERGVIPVTKLGPKTIIASRSQLRRLFEPEAA